METARHYPKPRIEPRQARGVASDRPTLHHASLETPVSSLLAIEPSQSGSLQRGIESPHSKATARTIGSNVSDFYLDLDAQFIGASDNWEEVSGQNLSQSEGAGWSKCFHQDDHPLIQEVWSFLAPDAGAFSIPVRLVSGVATEQAARLSMTPKQDGKGNWVILVTLRVASQVGRPILPMVAKDS